MLAAVLVIAGLNSFSLDARAVLHLAFYCCGYSEKALFRLLITTSWDVPLAVGEVAGKMIAI
jgi:hypothetical protein